MAVERLIPGTIEWEQFYANHINRYRFAADKMKPFNVNNVLDIACGVGYGTNFLASFVGNNIIGVDISDFAVSKAKELFSHPKVEFLKDNCEKPEYIGNYAPYDAIISFETLEHLKSPDLFLQVCFKFLKPGGVFIVSSPNGSMSSPSGEVTWKYHEKEYTAEELLSLVKKAGFSDLKLFGQQLNQFGKMKDMVRSELNKLNSNPFIRLGKWLQKKLKGYTFRAILPETEDDLEIIRFENALDISIQKTKGPFVLIITCIKS